MDGGGEEAVRSAVAVAGNDSADPGLVHRRQVQFGGHRAVGDDLIFLLVGEHVVHDVVDAVAQASGSHHHGVAVAADADGTAAAQHAVHAVVVAAAAAVVMELVAGREEQRRRTLEHVVVGRHSRFGQTRKNSVGTKRRVTETKIHFQRVLRQLSIRFPPPKKKIVGALVCKDFGRFTQFAGRVW